MKKLFILVMFLLCQPVISGDTRISCVDAGNANARVMAIALGDSAFVSEVAPAEVAQQTVIRVKTVNGAETAATDYRAVVKQKGMVKSNVVKEWQDGSNLCVELEFTQL